MLLFGSLFPAHAAHGCLPETNRSSYLLKIQDFNPLCYGAVLPAIELFIDAGQSKMIKGICKINHEGFGAGQGA